LYNHSKTWLSLLRLHKRIFISLRWDGRFFKTDSGEDSFQVNSPLLLAALREEREISSPKLSNKSPTTRIGSGAERGIP
jgi:hypothetical protein